MPSSVFRMAASSTKRPSSPVSGSICLKSNTVAWVEKVMDGKIFSLVVSDSHFINPRQQLHALRSREQGLKLRGDKCFAHAGIASRIGCLGKQQAAHRAMVQRATNAVLLVFDQRSDIRQLLYFVQVGVAFEKWQQLL